MSAPVESRIFTSSNSIFELGSVPVLMVKRVQISSKSVDGLTLDLVFGWRQCRVKVDVVLWVELPR